MFRDRSVEKRDERRNGKVKKTDGRKEVRERGVKEEKREEWLEEKRRLVERIETLEWINEKKEREKRRNKIVVKGIMEKGEVRTGSNKIY